jgi:hypothetical protein
MSHVAMPVGATDMGLRGAVSAGNGLCNLSYRGCSSCSNIEHRGASRCDINNGEQCTHDVVNVDEIAQHFSIFI